MTTYYVVASMVRMTNPTTAARCRNALKIAGFNARMVTVRESRSGSLTVTIRDASVKIAAVRTIAESFEHIDRDHMSGEILSGGNTFVTVEYLDSIVAPIATEIATRIRAADGHTVDVGIARVRSDRSDFLASVWRYSGSIGTFYANGIEHAANRLAVELLDAGRSLDAAPVAA